MKLRAIVKHPGTIARTLANQGQPTDLPPRSPRTWSALLEEPRAPPPNGSPVESSGAPGIDGHGRTTEPDEEPYSTVKPVNSIGTIWP